MNRLFGSETSFPLFFLGGRQAKLMKCFSWALSFPTNVDKLDLPMVAKDLSASSFASYLKCQRCSFEVYYRSHAVQALTLAYLQKKIHTLKAQEEIGAALVKK